MAYELLSNITEEGVVPESRLSTPNQAIALLNRLINNNQIRSAVNAKVAGAIDGNVPYSQAKLDAEGLGWQTNVNWRLLEGDVNAAQNPFYLLYKDVPNYMCITVDCPDYNGQDNIKFGQIMETESTRLLDKWKGFEYNMQLAIMNRTKFAFGNIGFPDKEDFRFAAYPAGTVYVDDEVTQEVDRLNLLYIYYEWKVYDLYNEIQKEGAAEAGWDIPAVQEAIAKSCSIAAGFAKWRQWEYWQNKVRDHDIWLTTIDPKVKTAWGYVKEFDEKITRVLIIADQAVGSDKWLYRKVGEYERWEQIIHPFFAEIGNGHWNGTKSIGLKAFNARDAQNRLKNAMVDAAFTATKTMLLAKDERALDALQISHMGPWQVINQELTPVQWQSGTSLDKPLQVSNMLEFDLRTNIGSSRGRMGDPASVQPVSAEQAKVQGAFENQISLGESTLFLNQLDNLYEEVFTRIKDKPRMGTKEYPHTSWEAMVAEFHKRCKEKGVPDTAFKHVIAVKAYRSIGRGSEILKQQMAGQFYQIVTNDPNVPQATKINALRNLLASLAGREGLEQLWPSTVNIDLTEDSSKAQDENGTMILGIPPIISDQQNNLAHATTHLKFWSEQYQAVTQQQMDPAAYLKMAQPMIPHTQQHLQNMQGEKGKGTIFQQLFNVFQQLSNETKAIGQRYQAEQQAKQEEAQKQQQAMAQAQQMGQLQDPETQVKMARVKADTAVNMAKVQGDLQIKAAKTQADIGTKAVQTRQNLAIADVTTANTLKNNNAKANASKAKDSKTK